MAVAGPRAHLALPMRILVGGFTAFALLITLWLSGCVRITHSGLEAPPPGIQLGSFSLQDGEKPVVRGATVRATPLPLDPEDPSRTRVGQLDYVAGWSLSSDDPFFGGFSGLLWEEERLILISDRGRWLSGKFDPETPSTPISDASILIPTRSFTQRNFERDLESIVKLPAGSGRQGYLITYENKHRIGFVAAPGENMTRLPLNDALDLGALGENQGFEAITFDVDDHLLLIAERGTDSKGYLPIWRTKDDKVIAKAGFKTPERHGVTAARLLPDGSLIIVTRAYSVISGVSVKLVHVPRNESLQDRFEGRVIAHLTPPLAVDNIEGLDIRARADGSLDLLLVSDDNFSNRQRTLLLLFRYQP